MGIACQTGINRCQLPLLRVAREAYPFVTLEDAYVICAQHLLGTSTVLFHNLFQMGLNPDHFSVIGKCYSTNPAVYFDLRNIGGLDVCSSSRQFSPAESFDSQYERNVQRFVKKRLEKILNSGCRKLIVVDDGGELIQFIGHLAKHGIFPPTLEIIGLEQTSSGFTKLQSVDLAFPVVNVARSNVKLYIESSIIADSIMQNLSIAFKEVNVNPERALLLGYGAIGVKVGERLGLSCPVDSFDPKREESSIRCFEDIDFEHYNLIVGCSGKRVINFSDFCLFGKQTVLASVSSSDREFCGVEFRSQLNWQPRCHEHISAHGVYLLNCGFPVNFSKHYHLVDDDRYQLTRSLLLAGILQAYSHTGSSDRFIDLDSTVQRAIGERFVALYPGVVTEANAKDAQAAALLPAYLPRKRYKSGK
jgi:S-adenosylhomocysteine hydrolase